MKHRWCTEEGPNGGRLGPHPAHVEANDWAGCFAFGPSMLPPPLLIRPLTRPYADIYVLPGFLTTATSELPKGKPAWEMTQVSIS